MKLQLHRSGQKPQWADIVPAERTGWQRLAVASAGVLTPANVVTLAGLALVATGLVYIVRGEYAVGLWLIVFGRLADLLDGYLAEITATKGPLGEKLDAGMDKAETGLALVALVIAGALPVWLALLVAAVHLGVAAVSVYGMVRQSMPHPSAKGKVGMALTWLGLGLFVLAKVAGGAADVTAAGGYICILVGVGLTAGALAGYAKAVGRTVRAA